VTRIETRVTQSKSLNIKRFNANMSFVGPDSQYEIA